MSSITYCDKKVYLKRKDRQEIIAGLDSIETLLGRAKAALLEGSEREFLENLAQSKRTINKVSKTLAILLSEDCVSHYKEDKEKALPQIVEGLSIALDMIA